MEHGFISCIPMIVLIIGALITKRIAEMMILSSLLAAILVYEGDFFSGWIDLLYGALSTASFQFVLIILLGFGAMIRLFQRSGALMGIGLFLSRLGGGPKKPLLIAWLLAFFMFVDDYLNTLAVSLSMREVTDKNGIPREHLAYQVSSMAACLCVLVPFTSWTAFTIGLISAEGLGYIDYLKAIPYMFFPLLTVAVCFIVAAGILPKTGALKIAYARVEAGGPVLPEEKKGAPIVDLEAADSEKPSSPLNFIVPVAVLIIVVVLSENELIHGLLAAIITQGFLYTLQKKMTVTEFTDTLFEGLKSMAPLAFVVCFAYALNEANEIMGLAPYLIGGIGHTVLPGLLPALAFIVVALATFATSGYWVIQVITVPIFIPLAIATGLNPSVIIAAIMSGVTCGSILCFYSDVVFMAAAGTGVSNIRQVHVSVPYVAGTAALAAAGYLALGLASFS